VIGEKTNAKTARAELAERAGFPITVGWGGRLKKDLSTTKEGKDRKGGESSTELFRQTYSKG